MFNYISMANEPNNGPILFVRTAFSSFFPKFSAVRQIANDRGEMLVHTMRIVARHTMPIEKVQNLTCKIIL